MNPETGKFIVLTGIVIVIIGIMIYFFHDKIQWIGHLPGDIRVERKNFSFYFPITTMIVVSVVVSVILWLIKKFL